MNFKNKNSSPGLINGKLAKCPFSPNCVSSQTESKKHFIEPFIIKNPVKDFKKIETILKNQSNISIINADTNYIHAECKTSIFKFTDDLEFLLDKKNNICHIRSASRFGYSDLGKNRKRVEQIRKLFELE